jgi:serine/threonine-protein kinase
VGDSLEGLRAALEGRYAIQRELGRGGMAMVYLAQDQKHDRPVALKVLHPHLAATLGPDRFTREIKLAAKLQHPHICGVLDSGEAAGQLWFTMPFVEGETLRERLNRERQIPLDEAVRLMREAADALDYAHRHGVVHRDIKPENILLADGHVLVADFGVAKALNPSGPHLTGPGAARADSITGTGMAIGTPAYMSPEQASGSREIDARTDVYALGCVFYEMLAGEPPYTGPNAQAIIAKRLAVDATPLSVVRPDLAEPLSTAVSRALHRTPAERFATTGEFARAVEMALNPSTRRAAAGMGPARRQRAGLLFGLGLLIGLGVLFAWRQNHAAGSARDGAVKRMAVLPFENLGAPEDEYFADGMTDEIRGKLSTIPGLQVTASSSASAYKGSAKSSQEIAKELGVDYLLLGKIRWEKGYGGQSRVRVSPELINVAKASTEWQQPFDAALTDVFQVQADVATKVAAALNLALSQGQQQLLVARPTNNLPAYDAYLRGNEVGAGLFATTTYDLRKAISYYERAVALDSTFAPAWAQLSRALAYLAFAGYAPGDARARALHAAETSLRLDPNLAAGRLALGDYYTYTGSNWEKALEQYTLGRQLAPQDPDVLTGTARAQQSAGRWEESLASLRQATAVDPRSVPTARRLALTLLWLRRYPEAEAAADRAVALSPLAPNTLEMKAMVRLAQGDLEGARTVIREAPAEMDPTAKVAYFANYWDIYWPFEEADQALLLRLSPSQFDDDRLSWGIVMAEVWDLRGDRVRSLAYGDSARIEGEARVRGSDDPYLRALYATALIYAGRKAEAVQTIEQALARQNSTNDAYSGAYNENLAARIYLRAGQPAKALDILERLLKIPYHLSPGWLRIDPEWKALRGNPRFERLLAGK